MSTIGINIKKIRRVKGLNQTDFANLFGLTRANIGSYEELRAEPKIETIIKISTHYKIPIDKLVKKELTVNEISNFDVFSSIPASKNKEKKEGITFISQKELANYPKLKSDKRYINSLTSFTIPTIDKPSEKRFLFNEGNDLYTDKDSFFHGDILLLERANKHENDYLGVIIDDNIIYKGNITFNKMNFTVQPLNSNKKPHIIASSKQLETWKITGKFTQEISTQNSLNIQIRNLEQRLSELEQRNNH